MESGEAIRASLTRSRMVSCPVPEVLFRIARQRTTTFQLSAHTFERRMLYALFVLHGYRLPSSAVREVDSRDTVLLTSPQETQNLTPEYRQQRVRTHDAWYSEEAAEWMRTLP